MFWLHLFLLLIEFVISVNQVVSSLFPYDWTSFNARFPPISDEEFVRRCRPDVNPEIALRVRRILSEALGIEYERICPKQRLVEDLGCD